LSDIPHLILLPGLDGTGELFAPLLLALGENVTTSVVRYGAELTFDEYVEAAARALPDDAVVIAESFSGPVAIALAARHPGKIRGLVLCASFAVCPRRALLRAAKLIPARAFVAGPWTPAMVRHFCFNGAETSIRPSPVAVVTSVPPAIMRARLACLATVDVRPLLRQIATPVLYLRASKDRIVGASSSRELTSQLANVTVVEIDGPHLLLQARPQECADAISTFLQVLTRPVTGGASASPSSTER
jgi:pimeloyl-ACP methyl ester carboxylesterase